MYRDELPRVFELRDLLPTPLPSAAYFQKFEQSILDEPVKRKHFRHIEADLQQLDLAAWCYLKTKLQPLLATKDSKRGWQSLFDVLNQAKGYVHLRGIGCTNIKFIPESSGHGEKTPDLEADLGSEKVLCEVKTINISDDEARARRDLSVREIIFALTDKFFGKLKSDLDLAKHQMDSYRSEPSVRKIAYVVINFDDLLHEYADTYRQQIDAYIAEEIGDRLEVALDIKPPYYSATIE